MSDESLGGVPLHRLIDSRQQLHQAVQLLTSFARAWVPELPDDRHRNLEWDGESHSLRTRPAAGESGVQVALSIPRFEVRVEREGEVMTLLPLRGRVQTEVMADLGREVQALISPGDEEVHLEDPEFQIPPHPPGSASPFAPDPEALQELAEWFTLGQRTLEMITVSFPSPADEIRCWPHHFDLGTLLHPREGTIGLGFSPGDPEIPEPYWYVRAYPEPLGDPAPGVLPFGEWHLEGWHGAVLRGSSVVDAGTWSRREARVVRFLDAAVAANGTLLLRDS